MARKEEAEQLLREGLSPSQIAERMGITISSVIQYLATRVGEGALRASDLYFAFPADQRATLQRAIDAEERWVGYQLLRENGLSREELALFKSLRCRRTFAGDLYEYVSEIEVTMHGFVRATLEAKYGPEESGWWRAGISEPIRTRCAMRREADEEPCTEPFAYTTLIDLSAIIAGNWACFRPLLPEPYISNRRQLESDFRRLNNIRNAIMHPVRERKWTEDDFEFVRRLRDALSPEEESAMEKGSPGVGPLNAILTGWLTLQVMSGGVAAPAAAQSLVVNGDFEAGNVGFTSDFTYSPSSIVGSSEYAIVGNPRDAHSNAASYGDHTLGDGNGLMLAANGRADDVPNVVWRQTASVQAGATYWFSVWHSLWTAGDGAIQLIVNGVPVSAPFQSPGLGEWAELSVAWTAAVTGPAELSIVNTTILWDPNDFALDDISFVPEAATGVRATSWGRLKDMYRRGGRR